MEINLLGGGEDGEYNDDGFMKTSRIFPVQDEFFFRTISF